MNIEIRKQDEEKAEFVVDGVDDTFMNTIRRICLVEIPTLAIEDVNIYKNDAKMFDEVLAHRLGLIPIKTDLESFNMVEDCDCDDGCSKCCVSFLIKEKGPKIVYSKDLKSDDPDIKPVYDTIPIVRLQEGEELELEAVAILGLGSEHAKWQATTTCGYKYYPKLTIDNGKIFNAQKYVDECPRSVLGYEEYEDVVEKEVDDEIIEEVVIRERLLVEDIENCSTCRTCQHISKEDDNAVDVGFEENKYIFKIETDGSLSLVEVLRRACDVLTQKADNIINFVNEEE